MFKIKLKSLYIVIAALFFAGMASAYDISQSKNTIVFNNLDKNFELSITSPSGKTKSFSIHKDSLSLYPSMLGKAEFEDGLYKFELVPKYYSGYLAYQIRNTNNQVLANEYAETYKNKNEAKSGTFAIANKALLSPGEEVTIKDQVILDDLVVNGSACIGQDCVNGESFGFDTIRLKENNLRIRFIDTSSSASFPTNDWQLTANDSSNGGQNKFSIDDIDSGRTPFTVEAGARNNALYVENDGDVGLGTSNPVVNLHIVDGNTPTLRLEQNGSSGFTPQTWDVAGNETNFFIRDATNGSRLPFKIRPSAPSNSLYVNTNGNIGLGTDAPSAKLHVTGGGKFEGAISATGNGGNLTVEDTNTAPGNRTILTLTNNGGAIIKLTNSNPFGTSWLMQSDSTDGSFKISNQGEINSPRFQISSGGDIIQSGVTLHSSDKNKKKNIVDVDAKEILNKVISLPISTWQYKSQSENIVHMGPMAQDFRAAFGLGINDVTISDTDVSGVALAAIKALKTELDKRNYEMLKLQENNNQLERRLYNLEAKIFAKEKSLTQQ